MAVFLATYRVYTFKIGFLKKVHGVQTPTTLPPCSLWVFPGDLSGSLGKKIFPSLPITSCIWSISERQLIGGPTWLAEEPATDRASLITSKATRALLVASRPPLFT